MLYMGYPWPPLRRLVAEWERRHGLEDGLAYFLRHDELNLSPDRRRLWSAKANGGDAATHPHRSCCPPRSGCWACRWSATWPAGGPRVTRIWCAVLECRLGSRRASRACSSRPRTQTGWSLGASSSPRSRIPAWTPLMAVAAAIVTDTGGPLESRVHRRPRVRRTSSGRHGRRRLPHRARHPDHCRRRQRNRDAHHAALKALFGLVRRSAKKLVRPRPRFAICHLTPWTTRACRREPDGTPSAALADSRARASSPDPEKETLPADRSTSRPTEFGRHLEGSPRIAPRHAISHVGAG